MVAAKLCRQWPLTVARNSVRRGLNPAGTQPRPAKRQSVDGGEPMGQWEIGRLIVEHEQQGLAAQFGKCFDVSGRCAPRTASAATARSRLCLLKSDAGPERNRRGRGFRVRRCCEGFSQPGAAGLQGKPRFEATRVRVPVVQPGVVTGDQIGQHPPVLAEVVPQASEPHPFLPAECDGMRRGQFGYGLQMFVQPMPSRYRRGQAVRPVELSRPLTHSLSGPDHTASTSDGVDSIQQLYSPRDDHAHGLSAWHGWTPSSGAFIDPR